MPRHLHPSREVHNLVLAGTLPARVRAHVRDPLDAASRGRFRSVVAGLRAVRPLTPERWRRGDNTASFEMVARTERDARRRGPRDAPVGRRRPSSLVTAARPGSRVRAVSERGTSRWSG